MEVTSHAMGLPVTKETSDVRKMTRTVGVSRNGTFCVVVCTVTSTEILVFVVKKRKKKLSVPLTVWFIDNTYVLVYRFHRYKYHNDNNEHLSSASSPDEPYATHNGN